MDKVASNFTINAPAAVIIAMYAAMAEKRGIPVDRLRGTPQNDILKEFIARGTYIYPPRQSLRLFRDILVFCTEHMPKLNITSIGGYHIREAGARPGSRISPFPWPTARPTSRRGSMRDSKWMPLLPAIFTFNAFGGSMEIYQEIAFQRAARRMYARMLKERFGAKNPRSMLIRQPVSAHIGCSSTTLQRPLNNHTRAVIGGLAAGMSGAMPLSFPPFDEPLGLGHSLEAVQLNLDATRILIHEAKVADVNDPWAGSYMMESLTDEIEEGAWAEFDKIEKMGGAVAAIESGYMQKAVAKSAYERQKRIERQEDFVVGVNCFNDENEIDVTVNRAVEDTYGEESMSSAEGRQRDALAQLKREREDRAVKTTLATLREHAGDETVNLMPDILACVKAEATLQEISDVLREVFGEAQPVKL